MARFTPWVGDIREDEVYLDLFGMWKAKAAPQAVQDGRLADFTETQARAFYDTHGRLKDIDDYEDATQAWASRMLNDASRPAWLNRTSEPQRKKAPLLSEFIIKGKKR